MPCESSASECFEIETRQADTRDAENREEEGKSTVLHSFPGYPRGNALPELEGGRIGIIAGCKHRS